MKIAFVGKGGSGKTTLASLFLRHLATTGQSTLAFDADINQHLAGALGASEADSASLPSLGDYLPLIKDYLRGENPYILAPGHMVKTTPAGRGSRLLRVNEDNPIYAECVRKVNGVRLAVTGAFKEKDLGVACYHSKVGAVELLLNHLVDSSGEYVVVDMTAGADSFASGLFAKFDVTFLVCEPTTRSVGVYKQYLTYADDFGIKVVVIGNKITDNDDLEFLRKEVGDDLLTWVGRSGYVRAAERGTLQPLAQLEPENHDALRVMQKVVDSTQKDWQHFQQHAIKFHLRNAEKWANERVGVDLALQVDPDFTFA